VEPTDVTVQILREIRDEIRGTNARLEKTREELGQRLEDLDQRLEKTRDDLGRRITQSEVRTATAIVELASSVQSVKELLADRLDLRDRVERCETDIADLKRRIDHGA
jgi:predicted  nucleic acid-binding Zn-ribbon protein